MKILFSIGPLSDVPETVSIVPSRIWRYWSMAD